MTTTVRTIFSINATDRSHDFLVIRRGPAGISIEAQSREDEWESATAGPFTPEQLRAALDEVAPAGSYTRTDEEDWQARAEKAEQERGAARVAGRLALQQRDAEKERADEAEQARDHLATVLATTARQRDEADKRNARPLTPDAIESVLHDVLPLSTEHLEADDIANIASDLHAALTEPTRPEGAEHWETWLSRLDYLHDETGASRADLATLANDLATEVGLTPTSPEEQP
ncbi:hypothetical protein [Brachybacterium massiliense]|uniref:hypothetical protein n=1 Tax=Brachybacterium massiliense TaxID=1755098 RepID=UPI000B3BCD8C|nr:hypothetical protein [Brachybacterium massiliense]